MRSGNLQRVLHVDRKIADLEDLGFMHGESMQSTAFPSWALILSVDHVRPQWSWTVGDSCLICPLVVWFDHWIMLDHWGLGFTENPEY